MPKLIENLRGRLLLHAREVLLQQGYGKLTIRGVAKACGVSVGTVYNCFASKDMLVASIMLEDWTQALARMTSETQKACSALDGLRAVFCILADFSAVFSGAWAEYSARARILPVLHAHHKRLIDQLCTVIEPLIARFGCFFHPALSAFLAETLLAASLDPGRRFEDLDVILRKLLQ